MARTKRVDRGKARPALTLERILAAAMRLADARGLDAVSMRALAEDLGVEAMSLYHHVGGKDQLLRDLADRVIGEMDAPDVGTADWKQALRRRAVSAREVLVRHPWAVALVGTRSLPGPSALRYVNASLGCLRVAGFSYAQAERARCALDGHVLGHALQESALPRHPARAAKELLAALPDDRYPHVRGLAEIIAEGRTTAAPDFDLGLDLILDGLSRALGKRG